MSDPDKQDDFLTALTALSSAYNHVTTVLGGIQDLDDRLDQATVLVDLMKGLAKDATARRVHTVGLIWERDQLSLAKLAARVGGSKAGAAKMVTAFKQQEEGREDR